MRTIIARDRQGEPAVYWHWQNLNEQPGERYGSPLKHGRAWLHVPGNCLGVEWVLGRWRLGWDVEVGCLGDDEALSGSLSVPGVTLYWSVDNAFPRWRARLGYESRKIGCSLHDGYLWVKLWAPSYSWSADQPRWMDWSFNFADAFFGRVHYSKRALRSEQTVIPLPEGAVGARVDLFESEWRRARWPFPKRVLRAKVTPVQPVPIPGKGENSWDCDDDAIYSLTTPASTVPQAVAEFVRSVLEKRERYGGAGWQPRPEAIR